MEQPYVNMLEKSLRSHKRLVKHQRLAMRVLLTLMVGMGGIIVALAIVCGGTV